MSNITKEIATERQGLPEPPTADQGATGAWQWGDDEVQPTLAEVEIITHRPRHTLASRLGRVAHWLRAPREYREEVNQRSLDIIHDVSDAGMAAKQVLPPRSIDFSDVSERRAVTTEFALDIRRRILLLRRAQQLIGVLSLLSMSQLDTISPLPVGKRSHSQLFAKVPPVDAIEQVASHIDGARPGDGDYVPLIVLK